MLIAARTGAWAKSGGRFPSARDYVQDGLIAIWDGIENAGWGVHTDDVSNGWKNLISGEVLNVSDGYTFKKDHLDLSAHADGTATNVSGTTFFTAWCNAVDAKTLTFEVATQTDALESGGFTDTVRNSISPNSVYGFVCIQATGCLGNTNASGSGYYWLLHYDSWAGTNHIALTFAPSTKEGRIDASLFRNAVNLVIKTVPSSSVTTPNFSNLKDSYWLLGKRKNYQNKPADRVYCCRIYNRTMTASEIAANYAIDKERFGIGAVA